MSDTEFTDDPRQFEGIVNPAAQFHAILALTKISIENQRKLDEKLTRHMKEETSELAKSIAELIKEAFPAGDPIGHRRHHELVIEREEDRAAFWKEMRIAAGKWLGLGLLSFTVAAVWTQVLKGPHS